MCHREQRIVLALYPGDALFTEVLKCPGSLIMPLSVLVQGRSLYVSMISRGRKEARCSGVYEYSLPPEFQLKC